jgi:flagellin-like hook-associated protein FlgL
MGPINTNVPSQIAQRIFHRNSSALNSSLEKLATGQRINRASDDPAGLISSENLRAVLAALDAETSNLERADHVIATIDGALGEISSLLTDAEGLVVANANSAGLSDIEREANQIELNSIVSTVNRLASSTSFNGDNLLDGSATINAGGASITIENLSASSINIVDGDLEDAQQSLHELRDHVLTQRGELGAFAKNTIGAQLNSNSIALENVAAAESAIRDTDYAFEAANLARLSILTDASLRTLGLANSQRNNVLRLLG